MVEYIVRVLEVGYSAVNVRRIKVEKPERYQFVSGQANEVSINKPELKNKKRPFTFTSIPEDDYIEFNIKMYPEHPDGLTKHFKEIKVGDKLIIREPWGFIHYEGKGIFIAGGAGITPFLSILKSLRKKKELEGNTLLYSNRTKDEIILESELKEMEKEGLKLKLFLTREKRKGYEEGRINPDVLRKDISNWNQKFYICGPPTMVGELNHFLVGLGANSEEIVFEK